MGVSHCIVITLLLLSQWFSSTHARPIRQTNDNGGYLQAVPSNDVPKPSQELISGSLGLTWDECRYDEDCVAPRTCMLYLNGKESRSCKDESGCVCDTSYNEFCLLDEECYRGEYCLIPFEGSIGACFSKTGGKRRDNTTPDVTPSTTPEVSSGGIGKPVSGVSSQGSGEGKSEAEGESDPQGGLCIGMNVLRNMSRGDLLFDKDVETLVLCDDFDSCATAGHVVVFNGSVMMMKSYCERVGCVERVMLVNNPRYRRARVSSFTKGLVLTAYSARYGTRAEEVLFRMLTGLNL